MGLWGLESLECFGLLETDDVFLRRVSGVFSTDLKYFSCMESSLIPPPLPSMLVLRANGCCRGEDDDIKLPDRVNDTICGSKNVSNVSYHRATSLRLFFSLCHTFGTDVIETLMLRNTTATFPFRMECIVGWKFLFNDWWSARRMSR